MGSSVARVPGGAPGGECPAPVRSGHSGRERAWFYGSRSEPAGPVDESVIRSLLAGGELPESTLVWAEGMRHWVPASTILELGCPGTSAESADRLGAWSPTVPLPQRALARVADGVLAFTIGVAAGRLPSVADHVSVAFTLACGFTGLLAWALVESLFLARTGTTPGKWLLSLRVRTNRLAPPQLPLALQRSLAVWWRGLGAGIPVVLPVAAWMSWREFDRTGSFSWDAGAGLLVQKRSVEAARLLLLLLVLSLCAATVALLA
jgi:hypothetical protein